MEAPAVSHNRSNVPADRTRINLHRDYEARYWSEKFNVARDELESVVKKVGVMADDVERELGRSLAA
jgi:HAMP domain-containing protein